MADVKITLGTLTEKEMEAIDVWYYFKRAMEGDREAADRVIEYMKKVKKGGTAKGDKAAKFSYEVYQAVMACKRYNEDREVKPLRRFSAAEVTARLTGQKLDAVNKHVAKWRKTGRKKHKLRATDVMLAEYVYCELHDCEYPFPNVDDFCAYLRGKI